ncbi:MAG: hypothetical protein PVH79_00130 [Candidatus Bathyarchaeota archaeon]|jgi:hypothetical protein
MIIPIADYHFDGPYKSLEDIESEPGVFAIISEFVGKYYLLDVDHAENVQKAIGLHERKKCWELHKKGKIRYAALYSKDFPKAAQAEITKQIRARYQTIPCGSNLEG